MGEIEVRFGWPHDGRHDAILDEVCSLIDDGFENRLLYLVPTATVARTVRRELIDRTARRAVPLIPVLTFNDLVARLLPAVQHDPDRPYRPITAAEKMLLIERAVKNQLDPAPSGDTEPLIDTDYDTMPGIVRRLAELVEELKRNLCPGGDALIDAIGRTRQVSTLDQAVAAVYDAYQDYLREHRLVDDEGAFFLVHQALEQDTAPMRRTFPNVSYLVVEGFRDFTFVEMSILGRVASDVDRAVLAVDYVPEAGELFAATAPTYRFYCSLAGPNKAPCTTELEAATEIQRRLTGFLRTCSDPERSPPADEPAVLDGLELRVHPDPRAEIAYIAGGVKQLLISNGYREHPERIAVMVPRADQWLDAVEELFPRYGIPLTSVRRKPLNGAGPVRAIMALLNTRIRAYQRADVMDLIASPYIADRPDEATISRHATALHITGGSSAAWLEPLQARTEYLRDHLRSAADTEEADRLETAARLLARLLETIQSIPLRATAQEYGIAIARLIDQPPVAVALAALRTELMHTRPRTVSADVRAIGSFRELCDQLCNAIDRYTNKPLDLAEFTELLGSALSDITFSVHVGSAAGVALVSIGDIDVRRYDHVFLAGLTGDLVPDRTGPAMFFREPDRRRLDYLSAAGPSVTRGWLGFVSALLSARHTVRLSCSSIGWDDKPTVPSVYIDELADAAKLAAEPAPTHTAPPLSYTDIYRSLGDRLSAHDDDVADLSALSDTVRELRRRQRPELRTMIRATRAELLRRRVGSAEYLGPYDGRLRAERALDAVRRRFAAGRHVFSVNQLERYATCPFSFFCERALRLTQPEEFREDAVAKDRGLLAHEILRRFFDRWYRDTGRAALVPADLDAACTCIREVADAVFAASPVSSYGGVLWRALCTEFVRGLDPRADRFGILRALLDVEAKSSRQPVDRYVEWRFGRTAHGSGPADQRSVNTELVLPTDRRTGTGTTVPDSNATPVRIAGKIDRIDLFDTPDRRDYLLLDYKTGSTSPSKSDVLAAKSYQLGIYALAAEEMLFGPPDRLDGIGFYKINRPEEVGIDVVKPPSGSDYNVMMDTVVRNVVDDVNSMLLGYFHPTGSDTNACAFCEYRRICRADPARLLQIDDPIVHRRDPNAYPGRT